jgi:hypothetical protein
MSQPASDPLTIDPSALIPRLEARYTAALQALAAEIARLVSENARLETALSAAIERAQPTEGAP